MMQAWMCSLGIFSMHGDVKEQWSLSAGSGAQRPPMAWGRSQ